MLHSEANHGVRMMLALNKREEEGLLMAKPDNRVAVPSDDTAGVQVSRRDILRALGTSGAALAAGGLGLHGNRPWVYAVQDDPLGTGTPIAEPAASLTPPSPSPTRDPGSPTVAEIALKLRFDVDAIFRFVADEIRYESYPGALRGAKGTLWGRAGNSVDQALLLAELLQEALFTARFAIGELDDEGVGQLIDATQVDEATYRDQFAQLMTIPEPDEPAPTIELTPEEEAFVASAPARAESFIETAKEQLVSGVQMIEAALAQTKTTLPEIAADLPERERRQHVWVQYAAGPEWIDLDPSMPHAEPGQRYATRSETLDALPDDLYHRIAMRVTAEVMSSGQAVKQDLLSFEARSQDLVGMPIAFLHAKPESLRALGHGITDTIAGTMQYIPHLVVPGSEDDVVPGAQRVTLVTGEGVLDAFGDSSRDGDTLAEWLEIDVLAPDAPPRHVVREVFDRVGVERRVEGNVDLSQIPLADLTEIEPGYSVYLPLQDISSIVVVNGAIPISYFNQDYAVMDWYADRAMVGNLHALMFDALALHTVAERGAWIYRNAPNITAFTTSLTDFEGERATVTTTVDLLHQSFMATSLLDNPSDGDPRVLAGVLNHVTERAIVEGDPAELAEDVPPISPTTVGRVFEEAERNGIPIIALNPAEPMPNLDMSARAKVRIAEVLAGGQIVIVPQRSVTINGEAVSGWWQVDPTTGETIDRMEDGTGGVISPYAVTLQPSAQAAPVYRRLGRCEALIFAFAANFLHVAYGAMYAGASSNDTRGSLAEKIIWANVVSRSFTGFFGGGAITAVCL
jgi:large repetitive protein